MKAKQLTSHLAAHPEAEVVVIPGRSAVGVAIKTVQTVHVSDPATGGTKPVIILKT